MVTLINSGTTSVPNLTNNLSAGGTSNQLDDFAVTIGVDIPLDVAARLTSIRNAIYQLARTVNLMKARLG